MATQAGIGVLIGLGLGSGITAFLMQRIIRRQDNALQQSINRLNRIKADHAQDLNEALVKMAADYEQQLAAKIERYQDTHEEQLSELEAEYEARLAALLSIELQASPEAMAETEPLLEPTKPAAPDLTAPDLTTPEPAAKTPLSSPSDTVFTPIPDPWKDTGSPAAPAPASLEIAESATPPIANVDTASPVRRDTTRQDNRAETVTNLGKAAAINRKTALRAVPQLGKLLKDEDATVRLAAVIALQESGSIKAIPFLRQALRDTDNRIVAAASTALSRFKGTKKSTPKSKKAIKKKHRR